MPPDKVEIEHQESGQRGQYLARVPGTYEAGRLTWTERAGVRHAEHTLVPHALRGRGIAAALVDALIADARREGFKVAPDCSYVAAKFDENPEWADLRA